jgi:hypothetical protein
VNPQHLRIHALALVTEAGGWAIGLVGLVDQAEHARRPSRVSNSAADRLPLDDRDGLLGAAAPEARAER